MRRLWLLVLPAMFLPDLGIGTSTDLGNAELSDYLVGPYLGLLVLGGSGAPRTASWRGTVPILVAFLVWATLSTLTINLRYHYSTTYHLELGLVKVGKLLTYGLAGVATMRALEADPLARRLFPWSMLAACMIMSVSLVFLRSATPIPQMPGEPQLGYHSPNLVSVALAMMYAWMFSTWASGGGSGAWGVAMTVCFPVLLLGLLFTDGRGGWVATVVAGGYAAVRFGMRPSFVAVGCLGLAALGITYESEDRFRRQLDMTLDPTQLARPSEFAASAGVDDGDRLKNWTGEAPKVANAPIFGSGLFHRGGRSRLWETGSHNFWLQMFLETGLVGGVLALAAIRSLWRAAGSHTAVAAGLGVPAQAALVAAFVGGLTGEYFYGGRALLALLLSVAWAVSMPAMASVPRPQIVAGPRALPASPALSIKT